MNENEILIGVFGAHMSSLPLNWQVNDFEATFVKNSKKITSLGSWRNFLCQ